MHCAYKKVTDNSAVTWHPTWTNSRGYGAITTGLVSAGGGAANHNGLLLQGVGQ